MIDHIKRLIEQKPVGSLDVEIVLKPHKVKDQLVKTIINRNMVNPHIMLIESSYGDYKSYDQRQILELKKQRKRYLKRLIKENHVVSNPTQSVFILKTLGKMLQLYNKTPHIVENLTADQIDLISKKSYYHLKENRLQGRLGKTSQPVQLLAERLQDLLNDLKERVTSVTIKTTHGRPLKL